MVPSPSPSTNSLYVQVTNGHKDPRSGFLSDYCDAEEFCEHPLFSKDTHALQIVLYYDELEICNPLGSRRKKHKIGEGHYAISFSMSLFLCVL